MKIYLTVYDYDFFEDGGYGWTKIQERMIVNKSYEDLIFDLMNEFDIECGWGGIWKCARHDEDGKVIGFALQHKGSSKTYVYDIIY